MSERLNKLFRQRTLLQEHLAWLEQEISAENSPAAKSAPNVSTRPPMPLARSLDQAATAQIDAETEALLAKHQNETNSLKSKLRLGCFMYFGLALLLLGVSVAGLYFFSRTQH